MYLVGVTNTSDDTEPERSPTRLADECPSLILGSRASASDEFAGVDMLRALSGDASVSNAYK